LPPLTDPESAFLLLSLLPETPLAPEVLSSLLRYSAGVPLFLEESFKVWVSSSEKNDSLLFSSSGEMLEVAGKILGLLTSAQHEFLSTLAISNECPGRSCKKFVRSLPRLTVFVCLTVDWLQKNSRGSACLWVAWGLFALSSFVFFG